MKKIVLYSTGLWFLLPLLLSAQVPIFRNGDCTILSENNEVVSMVDTIYHGKPSIKLDGTNQAVALLKQNELKNFRVEMDVAAEVMAGLGFRVSDVQNYHFIYFRSMNGGTEEAIQYIPVYNGALSWVFYNYPDYEGIAEFSSLDWFHTAIEVVGDRLRVFVNHSEQPQLDITIEDFGTSNNNLLLRSMFGSSYFSNVTIMPVDDNTPSSITATKEGFLRKWHISNQYPPDSIQPFSKVFQLAEKANQWQEIYDPNDIHVNFCEYFDHPNGTVVAKTTINALEVGKKTLGFDFIGRIQIRLNQETIFSCSKFRFERVDDRSFQILVDLQKGTNELVIIAEGDAQIFGEGYNAMGRLQHQNWGFLARVIED